VILQKSFMKESKRIHPGNDSFLPLKVSPLPFDRVIKSGDLKNTSSTICDKLVKRQTALPTKPETYRESLENYLAIAVIFQQYFYRTHDWQKLKK